MKEYKLNIKINIAEIDINLYYRLSFYASNKKEAKIKAIGIIRNNMELQNNPVYQQLKDIVNTDMNDINEQTKKTNKCKKQKPLAKK